MTDITIDVNNARIKINMVGHAGYSSKGNDIVCAAISTLEYILYAYCESNPDKAILKKHDSAAGYSKMYIIPLRSSVFDVVEAVCLGFEGLAESYPEHINFKKTGKVGEINN